MSTSNKIQSNSYTLDALFNDSEEVTSMLLKFKGQLVEVRPHPTEEDFWCLNDLFKASGESQNKAPNRFLRDQSKKSTCAFEGVPEKKIIHTKENRVTLTFVHKDICFKYAAWISTEFENAVLKCFGKAAVGDAHGAVDAALEVVVMPDMINKIKTASKSVNDLVEDWNNNQMKDRGKRAYIVIWQLIGMIVTGNAKVKEFSSAASVGTYFLAKGNTQGISAYIATCALVSKMMKKNIDYYDMKGILMD